MTLEQAKAKLAKMERGFSDPLSSAFIGGRVGFRKDTKKRDREIQRILTHASKVTKLTVFIMNEEARLTALANPKPSLYYTSVDEIEKGKEYKDCQYGLITVIRKNKNTVTIQTDSGYTETRKPTFIYKRNIQKCPIK